MAYSSTGVNMVPHSPKNGTQLLRLRVHCALEVHEVWRAIVHAEMEQHTRLPRAIPRYRVWKAFDEAGRVTFEHTGAWRVASGRK